MTFFEYTELKMRAERAGIGNDASLAQLLHYVQFREVVKRGHGAIMSELSAWERNIAAEVERRIKEAESDD